MGLFVQDIKVGLSNEEFLVEKINLPKITKKSINFYVAPGSVCYVNGMKLKGQPEAYALEEQNFGAKGARLDAFLCPDKFFDSIQVNFFAGQHEVCLSALKTAKAKFSIVGTALVEIDDYKELARYFNRSITKEDLEEEIVNNYRSHLGNEIQSYAAKYITSETTEVDLQGALANIVNDAMTNSRKTSSLLFDMGLMISKRGITLHLNSLDETDEVIEKINKALQNKALESIDQDKRDREALERDKERAHEINKIVAERTTQRNENTNTTITQNGHVEKPVSKETKHVFCTECGHEITSTTAKFCPNCGTKINR